MSEEVLPASAPTKGMVMLSSELQPEKAPSPMLVTESGTITDVIPVQSAKAELSILTTVPPLYVAGILIFSRAPE